MRYVPITLTPVQVQQHSKQVGRPGAATRVTICNFNSVTHVALADGTEARHVDREARRRCVMHVGMPRRPGRIGG